MHQDQNRDHDQSQHQSQSRNQRQGHNHPQTDHALAEQRVAPYYKLEAIGAAVHCQSSAGLLTTGAEPVSEYRLKVQKLGVVLYEVGVWKAVASMTEDCRSSFAAARSDKTVLLRYLPVSYFNAVHACLDWTPQDSDESDGLAKGLSSKAVAPL